MTWQRKRKGKNKDYSISRKLRKENKSNDEFEVMLNSLTLEEVVALKLEIASKAVNGKLYGLPLWRTLPNVTKDAMLKCAYSITNSQGEAARFLGINIKEFKQLVNKYKTNNYFLKDQEWDVCRHYMKEMGSMSLTNSADWTNSNCWRETSMVMEREIHHWRLQARLGGAIPPFQLRGWYRFRLGLKPAMVVSGPRFDSAHLHQTYHGTSIQNKEMA